MKIIAFTLKRLGFNFLSTGYISLCNSFSREVWLTMIFDRVHNPPVPGGISTVLGDVGVNTNYFFYPSTSVISSGLAIRFTDAVVISRNRPTDPPVHPNFRIVSLVLA
jgi:hypothetical protein